MIFEQISIMLTKHLYQTLSVFSKARKPRVEIVRYTKTEISGKVIFPHNHLIIYPLSFLTVNKSTLRNISIIRANNLSFQRNFHIGPSFGICPTCNGKDYENTNRTSNKVPPNKNPSESEDVMEDVKGNVVAMIIFVVGLLLLDHFLYVINKPRFSR